MATPSVQSCRVRLFPSTSGSFPGSWYSVDDRRTRDGVLRKVDTAGGLERDRPPKLP